jgi:adenine-specific DNA-methyltransferase
MKTNFKTKLYDLLKKDFRLWDEEKKELNETLLKDLIDKLDEKLIELLLGDKETNKKFFVKVKDVFVLKQNELKFFIDENKLDNSYTQYQNKIGLRVSNKLLSERDEVVLDWPFKDCVLEGGMTKEDQKRNEIFFNEILAKDEIDRLFDEKALVNWKKYTKDGEQEVKEIKRDRDGTIQENLTIKGNNLLALQSIKKQFTGKVKLIYIDPPYNTGNDGFKYNDNFNHSAWLTFMKNRLEIARNLLKDDGVIFVQCDDNEQAYLKILMDEIFKRDNFVSQIAWERSATAGLGLGGKIINVTEYILIYQKTNSKNNFNDNIFKKISYNIQEFLNYKILEYKGNKELIEKYISASGNEIKIFKHKNYTIRKSKEEDFINNFDKIFRTFLIQKENSFQHSLISKMDNKSLYSVDYTPSRGKNRGNLITKYYYNKELFSWLKDLSIFKNGKIIKNEKVNDFWDRKFISNAARGEGEIRGMDRMKKPEKLISFILELGSKKDDIILDYNLGTGTTCAVAHKMNRRYIGIEQLDYGENSASVRLKNVINGDQTGISKSVNWQGGGDFVYLELAKWNEEAKDKILKAKSVTELEKLFNELYERYFLNYNVKTKEFRDKILKEEGFKKLGLKEQKNLFVEMLDMNQMYVNFSERADKKYNLSKEDIALSEEFYNGKK